MSFSDKKYLLDGEPASANELIDLACELDWEFNEYWMKRTSEAASILRLHGYTVDDNPNWKVEKE